MPIAPRIIPGRRLARGLGLADDEHDLGNFRQPPGCRVALMLVELAEAAAECNVLLARQRLSAEQQHAMIEKRLVYRVERCFIQRLAEIGARYFGTERI